MASIMSMEELLKVYKEDAAPVPTTQRWFLFTLLTIVLETELILPLKLIIDVSLIFTVIFYQVTFIYGNSEDTGYQYDEVVFLIYSRTAWSCTSNSRKRIST